MKSLQYKCVEFFVIFIAVPVSFALDYPAWIKGCIGITGFIYVVIVLLRIEHNAIKIAPHINWKAFWKQVILQLLLIVVLTMAYVWLTDKSQLFVVLLNNPVLWVVILCFYSLFSVYPQELIYRTFFFQRYQGLFKSNWLFIVVNAALFSLAHIFFRNALVMVLTFIGGLLFALTFKKTKSTLLVSIEHALYGCWLFTVGMGSMLGFPS